MAKIKKRLPAIFFGLLFGWLFQIGFNDYRAWIAIIFEIGLTVSFVIQEPEIEEREEREKCQARLTK